LLARADSSGPDAGCLARVMTGGIVALAHHRRVRRLGRGDDVTGLRDPQPQRYEICVRGRLGEAIRSAFPALQSGTRGDATMLTGVLADQAGGYRVKSRHRCGQVSVTTLGYGSWTMLPLRVDRVVDRCIR
jgi:hypothetical protein